MIISHVVYFVILVDFCERYLLLNHLPFIIKALL